MILSRYLLKELIPPFLFGLVIFTTILVAGGVLFKLIKLMVEQNISLFTVSKLFLLSLPKLIILTLPMSILLATLMSLSRLSSDNEILALKAGGISLYTIALPIVFFAILISLLSIILQETVVPKSNIGYKKIYSQIIDKKPPSLQRHITIKDIEGDLPKRIIYAELLKNNLLFNVVVMEFNQGKLMRTITAEKAKFKDNIWNFYKGRLFDFDLNSNRIHWLNFKEQKVPISYKPEDIIRHSKNPEEMTIRELKSQIDFLKKSGTANFETGPNPISTLLVELNLKIALPLSSLVFALLGTSLGIRPHRSSTSIGVGLSALLIFIYYVIMTLTTTWGKAGIIPPILSSWCANITFGLGACFLIWQKAQR